MTLYLLTSYAVLGGFLFGYDTGVVSGAELFIQMDLGLTDEQIQLVVSVTVGFAAIGSALSGVPLQRYGRRPVIIIAAFFYAMGSVVVALAPDFPMLMLGRSTLGLGVGLSSMAIPVYIAEAAPSHQRGRLVGAYTLFIVLGQAVSCFVNLLALHWLPLSKRWRFSMGIAALPAVVQLFGFCCLLPESPRWLIQNGKLAAAKKVVSRLRRGSDAEIEAELAELENIEPEDLGDVCAAGREVLATPHLRRIFRLGWGLMALQQLSGINTIMYYGATILVLCGFDESQSVALTALLALAQGLGILVSMQLFDRLGRRPLIIGSTFFSALSILAVAAAFAAGDHTASMRHLALAGVVFYLLFFGLGLSGGSWIVNAEIYPTKVRGIGNSGACTINWLANYLVSASFLSACKLIGVSGTFSVLGCVGLTGAIVLGFSLPETSGLSLEEIEKMMFTKGSYDRLEIEPLPDDEEEDKNAPPPRNPLRDVTEEADETPDGF